MAGLEANPKDLGSLVNIPFPTTLRSMQSFLGSLNYYSRFIEDFAVYASVLYELREANYFEISRIENYDAGGRRSRSHITRRQSGSKLTI